MYEIFRQLIGYQAGSTMYSYETYILYGVIAMACLLTIWFLDVVVRIIRGFVRK